MKNNFKEFQKSLQNIQNNLYRGIQIGLHKTNEDIKKDVIDKSKEAKTGKTYKIKTATGYKIHIASAPTEHYARLTGKMNKMIFHNVNGLEASIGSQTNYAPFVEFGTKKMTGRKSFAKSGIYSVQKTLENNIKNGINSKLKGE